MILHGSTILAYIAVGENMFLESESAGLATSLSEHKDERSGRRCLPVRIRQSLLRFWWMNWSVTKSPWPSEAKRSGRQSQ